MKTRNLRKPVLSAISLLMAAWMLSVSAPLSYAEDAGTAFVDVTEDDWFCGDVEYAYENGIINGVGDGRFAPNGTMTRAMAVTMLYRMAGEPDVGEENSLFSDVSEDQWYTNSVLWAMNNDIVYGYDHFRFGPDKNITRAEFSVMLVRYAVYARLRMTGSEFKSEDIDLPFSDKSEIPSYADMAVWLLSNAGIVNGKEDGIFDPDAEITRAESAAMLHRFDRNTAPLQCPLLAKYDLSIASAEICMDPSLYANPEQLPYHFVGIIFSGENYNIRASVQLIYAKASTRTFNTVDIKLISEGPSTRRAEAESLRPLIGLVTEDIAVFNITLADDNSTETLTCYSIIKQYDWSV